MPRKTTAEATTPTEASDAATRFDPVELEATHQAALENENTQEGSGQARRFVPRTNPFAILTIAAGGNKLHLGSSETARAHFIRFDNNPNEGRQKDDPHPVLKMLKDEGYAYRTAPDGGMAWKKPWADDQFSYVEDQQARAFAQKVADALGRVQDQGVGR